MLMKNTATANAEEDGAPVIDLDRWETLKNRLADELSRGFTFNSVERITGIQAARLEAWATDPEWFRVVRRVGDLSVAEQIEQGLEHWFIALDAERREARRFNPGRVETSVTRAAIEGFEMARDMKVMVDICIPSGAGKTESMAEYIARRRKVEGFDCPVWKVELSEFTLTSKAVLTLIAERIRGKVYPPRDSAGEFELATFIEEQTQGRDGLLIVDEAQHLADAKIDHGLRIVNGLRRFTDGKLFGIALLENGEIYRRLKTGKHDQLKSRLEDWRIEVTGVTADDVDLVMAAWGVSGKEERAWCVRTGTGPGQLRAMVEVFKRCLHKFGRVDIDVLESTKPMLAGRGGR